MTKKLLFLQTECRLRARRLLIRASLTLLLERWIHVPVLEDLFQIRPNAQVRHVIGDR